MKLILAFVTALAACSGSVIKDPKSVYTQSDRYVHFPDGDGIPHLVDLEEPVDEEYLEAITKNPEDNIYWLYTRRNPLSAQVLTIGNAESLSSSNFDGSKEVIVVVHGWNSNGYSGVNTMLTEAFLQKGDVNVVVLDWRNLANRGYPTAKNGVPAVGRELGRFLVYLTTLGASFEKMHLVGFSLGGHLVGCAGREAGGRIQRITALDPAGPLWSRDDDRVTPADARYVEVIHTDTTLLGFSDPCGHTDFYPNGGSNMPGCLINTCSHSRSYEYMAATVKYDHLQANWCATMREASRDRCSGSLLSMGNDDINKTGDGIYRVNTDRRYPY